MPGLSAVDIQNRTESFAGRGNSFLRSSVWFLRSAQRQRWSHGPVLSGGTMFQPDTSFQRFPRQRIPQLVLRFLTGALLMSAGFWQTGCQPDAVHYREVKRVHEKVTEAEWQRYLRVVRHLPDKRVPALPVFRPLPNWNPGRTLPVRELAKEERKLLERGWDVRWLADQLKRNRAVQRAVRREGLTVEQFVGLTLALGAALSRAQLRDNQNLEAVSTRGAAVIRELMQDERTFAQLSREERFSVLRKAGWLTRADRAERLLSVPPENLALVHAHAKQLAQIFPRAFLKNPLDDIADLLEERGMPFEELSPGESDETLSWNPDEAVIGHDRPDPEPSAAEPKTSPAYTGTAGTPSP